MTVTCEQLNENLELLVAGECAADLAERLERHLDECTSCRREYEETQHLFGLLEIEYQAEDAATRVRSRIEEEKNLLAFRPRVRRPFMRIVSAAALLLTTLGLFRLAEQDPLAAPPDRGLSLALIVSPETPKPDRVQFAHERVHPKKVGPFDIEIKIARGKPEALTLEPAEVDLSLEMKNQGREPLTLFLGEEGTELRLDIQGPDVRRQRMRDASEPLFLKKEQVRLASGQSYRLKIDRLVSGKRGDLEYISWTPGKYMLTIHYRVLVSGLPARFETFHSPPIELQVRE